MRILINALSGIGDALMFTPALALLKKHSPESIIDVVVMFKPVEDLFKNNPHVNKVYFIDFLKQSKFSSLKQTLALRKHKYDVSINVYPSNRREYNLVQYLESAKVKIAHRYNNYSKSNLDFLNNILVNEVKDRHNVIENFELVKAVFPNMQADELGQLEIYLTPADAEFAAKYYSENELEGKPVIGFHAGSATFKGHINKRWSAIKYASLAKQLTERYNAKVLLFGTEKDVNEMIKTLGGEDVIIPETKNLPQSLALMEKCHLFVSNDSALMHMAAGLAIPQVAVFAYTNYKELHPWQNRHIIVRTELDCSPCFFNSPKPVKCIYSGKDEFKCIKLVEVSDVMAACEALIEEIPGNVES
ncbi:MAG: glycosyltransferase family 9 protein [Ignavibacteria bacterium]|nr:glycosyltransferase family 9 protein [Ignavibacteria bacterium]